MVHEESLLAQQVAVLLAPPGRPRRHGGWSPHLGGALLAELAHRGLIHIPAGSDELGGEPVTAIEGAHHDRDLGAVVRFVADDLRPAWALPFPLGARFGPQILDLPMSPADVLQAHRSLSELVALPARSTDRTRLLGAILAATDAVPWKFHPASLSTRELRTALNAVYVEVVDNEAAGAGAARAVRATLFAVGYAQTTGSGWA